ncbi:S24/S26 family peptidase [Niabella defluvii]|nr:S24/S26 family peptidase [Niabella sp. I65]
MYQTLSSSDWVIGEYVEQMRDVKDERVYIFVTKEDGILIKRALNRSANHGKFILKSDNIEEKNTYPNIVLDVEQVAEIWEAKLYFSRQFRAPGSIYNRLSELEAMVTLLNEQNKQLLAQKSQ